MTPNLTSRQESFCHHYARHGNGALAAREAGYGAEHACQQASRLLSQPHIQARTGELKAGVQSSRERNQDALIERLRRVYDEALKSGALAVAVRAVEAEARICGLVFARMPAWADSGHVSGQPSQCGASPSAYEGDGYTDQFVTDLMARARAEVEAYESANGDHG